jgi:hypothetical protein
MLQFKIGMGKWQTIISIFNNFVRSGGGERNCSHHLQSVPSCLDWERSFQKCAKISIGIFSCYATTNPQLVADFFLNNNVFKLSDFLQATNIDAYVYNFRIKLSARYKNKNWKCFCRFYREFYVNLQIVWRSKFAIYMNLFSFWDCCGCVGVEKDFI